MYVDLLEILDPNLDANVTNLCSIFAAYLTCQPHLTTVRLFLLSL